MTYIIGDINNMGIWYPLFNILSGGLLFGAVFMATDPVTSPTTRIGQLLFGLGLGLFTVIFRFATPYPEGVLTSILTMNMLVIILDIIGAKAKFKSSYIYVPIISMIILILSFSLYIGNIIKPTSTVDEKFHIVDKVKTGNNTVYKVSQKGFHGPINATITISNGNITKIDITSQEETYWEVIESNDYLDKLINGQKSLDKVDTVSGATISSGALKNMVTKTLEDYKAR
jgi:electron transport complex protein RnfD